MQVLFKTAAKIFESGWDWVGEQFKLDFGVDFVSQRWFMEILTMSFVLILPVPFGGFAIQIQERPNPGASLVAGLRACPPAHRGPK